MTLSPCLVCGEPAERGRCPMHYVARPQRLDGYDRAWRSLSLRARRLQPFCSDCGAVDDLSVDHSPEAWERKAAGLAIRLEDVDVVCRACNSARGQARPSTRGGDPDDAARSAARKAKFASHTAGKGVARTDALGEVAG